MQDIVQQVEALNQKEAPEFEPYKYKYEARSILEKSITDYESKLKDEKLGQSDREKFQIGCILCKHYLAVNYNDTEERSRATPILSEVVSFLTSSVQMRMRHVLILIKSLNYLALILSSMQEEKKSKKYLDQAEQLYKECHSGNNLQLVSKHGGDVNALESEYTHTLFYFAQLYKNLGHEKQSAAYCHKCLQRQLKYEINNERLNRKEWAVNAINLAVFYINTEKFRQAIHCIEAAIKVSESIKAYSVQQDEQDEEDVNAYDDEEEEQRLKADIERTWGVLYMQLLKKSFDIMNSGSADEDGDDEHKKAQKAEEAKKTDEDEKAALTNTEQLIHLDEKLKIDNTLIMFDNIELKQPPKMELASTYKEAKELFVSALNHSMSALQFYVLDGFVTDHVKIAQTVSNIYKYLAFFEPDLSTKCKLHKRRINLLKDIEVQLSVNAYEDLVQDLCYELGSVYENMGSLKKDILEQQQQQKQAGGDQGDDDGDELKQIKKINDLYTQSIHYLSKYVHIFEYPPNAQSKEMQPIPEQFRFEYFQAHFLMAALYGKLIPSSKQSKVDNAKKSLSGYQHCVRFYTENGPISDCKVQFQIAKEMKDLLPLQISSINK